MVYSPGNTVLVGYDGSEQARSAVRWAADEAVVRGAGLRIVRLFEPWWPVSGFPVAAMTDFGFDTDRLHEEARADLAAEVDAVSRAHPELSVTSELRTGPVAEELMAAAACADLLVLGASGMGQAGPGHLGSAAEGAVRSPSVPTVVVRGAEPHQGGQVVVGVDGSEHSTRAAEFAVDYADRHQAPVTAVHAWSDRPLQGIVATLFSAMGDNRPAAAAERLVEAQLREATAAHPDVPVTRAHRDDSPAHALLDAANGAALLVVGTHGRGAVGRAVFGSVSRAVTHRAPCPVAVVPQAD